MNEQAAVWYWLMQVLSINLPVNQFIQFWIVVRLATIKSKYYDSSPNNFKFLFLLQLL